MKNNSIGVTYAGTAGLSQDAHRNWASRPRDQRFGSLADLKAHVENRRSRSVSSDFNLDRLALEQTGENDMQLAADGRPLEFTHWSFGQLCSTVGAPAAYLRKLPAELAVRNLNHGLDATRRDGTKRDANKLLTIRPSADRMESLSLSDPIPPSTLQAVTSPTYGRIWDADCVSLVERLIDRSDGAFHAPHAYRTDERGFGGLMRDQDGRLVTEPSGLFASDRDVFVYMIDGGSRLEIGNTRNGDTDTLHRGFMVSNSETGNATFTLTTFYFRGTCGNLLVFGAQDVNRLTIRHSRNGPIRFDSEAWPVLKNYTLADPSADLAQIEAARALELPTVEAELISFASTYRITRPELRTAMDFATREEGQCRTAWDLVNGLTASAREIEHIDTRTDLERRAGKILSSLEPRTRTTVSGIGLN